MMADFYNKQNLFERDIVKTIKMRNREHELNKEATGRVTQMSSLAHPMLQSIHSIGPSM
jgi:hypothetical protein